MNQAWSQSASAVPPWNDEVLIHRPDPRLPASVYLTSACRQEATDTSFRCVAPFPAEPTFFFWPSQGKCLMLLLFIWAPCLGHSGRQNTLPGFTAVSKRPDFEELLLNNCSCSLANHLPMHYITEMLNRPYSDLQVLIGHIGCRI